MDTEDINRRLAAFKENCRKDEGCHDNGIHACNWIILGFKGINTFEYKSFDISGSMTDDKKVRWCIYGIKRDGDKDLCAIFSSFEEAENTLRRAFAKTEEGA